MYVHVVLAPIACMFMQSWPLLHVCSCSPGPYLTSALENESSFWGIPLLGKYDLVQLKADMKCLCGRSHSTAGEAARRERN